MLRCLSLQKAESQHNGYNVLCAICHDPLVRTPQYFNNFIVPYLFGWIVTQICNELIVLLHPLLIIAYATILMNIIYCGNVKNLRIKND